MSGAAQAALTAPVGPPKLYYNYLPSITNTVELVLLVIYIFLRLKMYFFDLITFLCFCCFLIVVKYLYISLVYIRLFGFWMLYIRRYLLIHNFTLYFISRILFSKKGIYYTKMKSFYVNLKI